MPAASDPVALPVTFRPLGVRVATYVFGGLMILVAAVVWFSFSAEVRSQFTLFQRGTLLAFGIGAVVAGHALARSRVVARDSSLTVVNGFRSRRYDWSEVVRVSLRQGSPWATLDLSDGTSVAAMGIQGSDGTRAVRQVRELRALVDAHTRTERND
ncbi:MAG TPA: PH domain-containing protein [Nocardioidaceae bacterium]|jgi:hypothetical protein|nr:PH domain-containing protein [Nocardioidaceae bacterium]